MKWGEFLVNFGERLGSLQIKTKVNPIEIYDSLDRSSDKGPLRPVQVEILER